MRALNLYTLTRVRESGSFSRLAQVMSGRKWHKAFSAHEIASVCSLVDGLADVYSEMKMPASPEDTPESGDWLCCFDGFYFSFTIEHISKEFDLLKLSADGSCVLNIELKSESIEEDRIRKQLEQNRYYLGHISRTILSYTYVMETDELYCLNDRGHMRKCQMEELAAAMARPGLQEYVEEEIGQWFRARDYLISPVGDPDKLLSGRYFLTNQQAEFRRQILEILQTPDQPSHIKAAISPDPVKGDNHGSGSRFCGAGSDAPDTAKGEDRESASRHCVDSPDAPDAEEDFKRTPVISLTGGAGTGKTLLLFDLALELSRKKRVLFLHGGPLREGHRILNSRLHKVTILSGTEALSDQSDPMPVSGDGSAAETGPATLALPDLFVRGYDYVLVDEANRLSTETLAGVLQQAETFGIPCILSYDSHSILGQIPLMENAEILIADRETLHLELSGNIRINRPIFSFLRALFHQKDKAGHVDYDCIDILYAGNREEAQLISGHYLDRGYVLIRTEEGAIRTARSVSGQKRKSSQPDEMTAAIFPAANNEGDLISREYDKVLMILDRRFYYDDALRLRADGTGGAALAPLYEGLSRAREKLCLLIVDNEELFSQVLAIREG